jgi:hypothetical protein
MVVRTVLFVSAICCFVSSAVGARMFSNFLAKAAVSPAISTNDRTDAELKAGIAKFYDEVLEMMRDVYWEICSLVRCCFV